MWASGARSPDAPHEPFREAGIDLVASRRTSASTTCGGRPRSPSPGVDFQRHQHANPRLAHRPADAGGVREHEAPLQDSSSSRRNPLAGQQAEAGVDAIDGAAFGNRPRRHGGGRGVDGRMAGGVEVQFHRLAADAPQMGQGEFSGLQTQVSSSGFQHGQIEVVVRATSWRVRSRRRRAASRRCRIVAQHAGQSAGGRFAAVGHDDHAGMLTKPMPTPPPWCRLTQVAPPAVLSKAFSSGQSETASEPSHMPSVSRFGLATEPESR